MLMYSLAFRHSLGPFYYNIGYDPSYVYLINSLNIAQFESPQHVDHPGTPVQVTGAIIIKSFYLFFGKSDDISKDVFEYSEKYLKFIFLFFLIFAAVVLFFCGTHIYRITGAILPGILLQLSIFSTFTVSFELTSVTSEIFLIPLCLLLVTFSFSYSLFRKKSNANYLLMFSVICGIAVATKLIFFPMIIIPFILIKGMIRKLIFILLTLLFFCISVLPAVSNYEYFSGWVTKLFMHEGIYGFGEKTIINPMSFLDNMRTVFQSEIFFTISFILSAVTIFIVIIHYRTIFINKILSAKFTLLMSFFLTSTIQLLIVAKHYSPRYMIPVLILSAPSIYLSAELLIEIFKSKITEKSYFRLNHILISLIIIILSIASVRFYSSYLRYTDYKNQTDHINELIENYPSENIIVSTYGSSRKEYALVFALYYSGEMHSKYNELLLEMYPDSYYFDYFNKTIFTLSPEYDRDAFKRNKVILLLNSFPSTNQAFKDDLKESYSAEVLEFNPQYTAATDETLYEVRLK